MPKKTQRLSSGTHRARTEEKVKVITELRRKYPLEDLLQFLSVPEVHTDEFIRTLEEYLLQEGAKFQY